MAFSKPFDQTDDKSLYSRSVFLVRKKNVRVFSVDPFKPFIIFSNRHEIRRIDLNKGEFSVLVPGLRNTIALDFHLSQSALYWTDVVEDKIFRGKLSENGGECCHSWLGQKNMNQSAVWLLLSQSPLHHVPDCVCAHINSSFLIDRQFCCTTAQSNEP